MAKWIIYLNRNEHLTMLYQNLVNGAVHNCGELRRDTPAKMILDWVIKQAATQPGDIVKFPDGTVISLVHAKQHARA